MAERKLTKTSVREWSCLSGGGEEEDGLGRSPQESPSAKSDEDVPSTYGPKAMERKNMSRMIT